MYRSVQIWSWIRLTGGYSQNLILIRNASSNRSVEDIYQRKTPLEHVLLRPEPYIGSVDFSEKAPMWVYDSTTGRIVRREISYVPGLYKIFDEILVNAADNKRRDPKMNEIRVDIDRDSNQISIYNNGRGVPVQVHRQEKKYVPELIFGTLLTSSNYDDSEKKVTGGRHGYGAKLCNIFSTEFTVETQSRSSQKRFKQTWSQNMSKSTEPEITDFVGGDFTKVTFRPDLSKFRMDALDEDIVALMCRRAFDVAGVCGGVRVLLNGVPLECSSFPDYVAEYLRDEHDIDGNPLPVIFERPNERWEIGVAPSDRGFQQVSFVNSIATTNGGRHIDHVLAMMVPRLIEGFRRKADRMGIQLKPHQIRNHLWLFVNCLIENPTFDSQTKETLTLAPKKFGSECEITESFLREVQQRSGIMEAVASWARFRELEADSRKSARSSRKITGLPKLEDANNAGGPNAADCSLILTEGDSAKSLAVAGLAVVGRDNYGVYPLRGKMLNVRDAPAKQLSENAEVSALVRILGLQYRLKYESEEERKTLRYGKLLIMADQDQDGSHIKGLVINFIHCHWPALLRHNFIQAFITPIVKVWRSATDRHAFYSMPEYAEWRSRTPNWRQYRVKYYKGLGTSSSAEVKDYFTEMEKHRVEFAAATDDDEDAIVLAFGKNQSEQRKEWLTEWMESRRQRRESGQFEEHLYSGERHPVRFADFVNKELVHFSNADNERSIPSLMDGLKPGQRKVLFTCFKRADKKEMKVSQLAGAVAEMSAYHHGEASLMSTIINMAQNFVGSNNLNLLQPIGQFGTRLQGGRDAASPRYIYTQLNPLTRLLFPAADDPILRYRNEDNQWVEPEYYAPILPTVLVNGAEGIGTAWATKIPMFSVREVLTNVRRLIRDGQFLDMQPSFRGFDGSVRPLDDGRFCCEGKVEVIGADLVEISELPVGQWTLTYKETVLEPMRSGEGSRAKLVMDFKEYHTEDHVRFVVRLRRGSLRALAASPGGLINIFKLRTFISLSQLILFDADGVLRKFPNVAEIFASHFAVRRRLYEKRKQHLEASVGAAVRKLDAQRRFIVAKTSGQLRVEGRPKSELIAELQQMGFPADPVAEWRSVEKRRKEAEAEALEGQVVAGDAGDEATSEVTELSSATTLAAADYDYLLGMPLWRLTAEEVASLQTDCDAKAAELQTIQQQTWAQMWEADLDALEEALNRTAGYEELISNTVDSKPRKGRPRKDGATR